ncbi:putative Nucleoside diphosphate kinase [Paratrimastix pyriformis]|uniref:Nucleoside diphosphate kinase n=1 Tax=Paratrimastix pyriformis TaxID=342808 RepID=A0ABQ8UFF2_9EUKA|nr:putative Nucleoside diphosphate kinase [Paratrimastix pyriformis]
MSAPATAQAVPAGPVVQDTFLCVKPDGVERGLIGEMIVRFERKGLQLVGMKMITPSRSLIETHYAEHRGKGFFNGICEYMSGHPVVAMVWRGVDAISVCRTVIGATNPTKAAMGTIRGDFGMQTGRNLIHGSDGPESAAREIGLWFRPEEITPASVVPCINKWLYE